MHDPSMSSSDRSTYRTTYDRDPNETINSAFFKQLDQSMGAKLRATIARPAMSAMLTSLPAVSASLSSATTVTSGSDDPIDDLDAIIDDDDDDIGMAFHDPLDDLFQENEMLEVINPNLRLPGSQGGSKGSSPSSVGTTPLSDPHIHVHLHLLVLRWKLMQCWPLELD